MEVSKKTPKKTYKLILKVLLSKLNLLGFKTEKHKAHVDTKKSTEAILPAETHSVRIVICGVCSAKVPIKKDIGLYRCPSCRNKLVSVSDSVSAQYSGPINRPDPKTKVTHKSSTRKSQHQKESVASSSRSQSNWPIQTSVSNAKLSQSRETEVSITTISKIFNIVGFKHRDVELTFIRNISGSSIQFLPEPSNKYDPNAIKCITSGHHFGYIERSRAAEIRTLIERSSNFATEVLDFNQYKMSVEVNFQIFQKEKDRVSSKRQPNTQINIVAPNRAEAAISTPIRITESWVEIQIISEASIHITQRGYVPVLRVRTDKHKTSRLLIVSARSISFPLEEMRQDHGGQFSGLRFSLRKSGPGPKDPYEFQ